MSRAARHMISLLDREKRALMAGDIAAAVAMTERKARLAETIEAHPPEPELTKLLKMRAEENMRHLDAARRGIESAHRTIEAWRNGTPTRTYAANGSRHDIANARHGTDRRA